MTEANEGPRQSRARSIIAAILVTITSIGVVLSTTSIWVRTSVTDTERFVALVEPTLERDAIITPLADFISEAVIEAIDPVGRLEARLGEVDGIIALLANPLAGVLESRISEATETFLRSDAAQDALVIAVERAHVAAVAVIRGDADELDRIEVVDGEVKLDVVPIIVATVGSLTERGVVALGFEDFELPEIDLDGEPGPALRVLTRALGIALPDDFGQVTVMSEETLSGWQSLAATFNRILWAELVVTALALVGALLVSMRRRRTAYQLTFGIILGFLLAGAVERRIIAAVEDAVASEAGRGAAAEVLDVLLRSQRTAAWIIMGIAIVLAVATWVVHHARQRRIEEARLPLADSIAGYRDGFVGGGVAAAVLAIFLVGWGVWSLVITASLLILYLWYLEEAVLSTAPRLKLTDSEPAEEGVSGAPDPADDAADDEPGPDDGDDAAGRVRINTADATDLASLPGVGPAQAVRIVGYRDEHGPFESVEGLMDVPGIGASKLAALRDVVTVT